MEKNEEWGVGGKWAEKEGYVQNERKTEKKGGIKKEREKDAEGRQLFGRDNDKGGDDANNQKTGKKHQALFFVFSLCSNSNSNSHKAEK